MIKHIIYPAFMVLFMFTHNVKSQTVAFPEIISVSVDPETGYITVKWKPSNTPGVVRYDINYPKVVGLGNGVSYEKVPYSDVNASDPLIFIFNNSDIEELNATIHPVGLVVTAYTSTDESKNDLDYVPKDSTIFVTSSFDSCTSSISLTWNDYNSWRGEIAAYKIYQSIDNQPYTLVETINGAYSQKTNSAVIGNIMADRNYAHYILAVRDNTDRDSSSSYKTELFSHMASPPDYIHAEMATYLDDNHIEVLFNMGGNSELHTYNVLRATSASGPFDIIKTYYDYNDTTISFTDNINYFSGPYYYQLSAVNYCDQIALTSENTASSILINGTNATLVNQINWNNYENWLNGNEGYEISRKFGNDESEVIATITQNSYTDDLSALINTSTPGYVCYTVKAVENGTANYSNSNTWCVELPLNIRFEFDAFIPGNPAGNNSFGPSMDFIPEKILFQIYNKWGEVVYESKDPYNLRWEGTINNKYAPEGVYVYFLYAELSGRKPLKLRGNVTVAYP